MLLRVAVMSLALLAGACATATRWQSASACGSRITSLRRFELRRAAGVPATGEPSALVVHVWQTRPDTTSPLWMAQVSLFEGRPTDTSVPLATVLTDSAGTASVLVPRTGTFYIRARAIGYRWVIEPARLRRGFADTLRIDLPLDVHCLQSVGAARPDGGW